MVTTTRAPARRFRVRNTAIGVLLLASALTASALTIGRLRGAAWLGQPLDVSVPVQNDPGQSPAALCFEAEVFHGDTRQDGGRVRLTVDGAAQPVQVRVQTSVAVDEPVVIVYLRETCVSKTSRRFVLLSEMVPEAQPAPLGSPAAAAPAPVPQAAVAAPVPAPLRIARPRSAPPPAEPATSRPASDHKPPVDPAARKPARPSPPAPVAKPQLKLDAVDVLRERVAQLEAAVAQASQPASSSLAEDVQRLQKLEQSVQKLLALAAQNERSLADLRQRLEQAEAEKYDNGLVYGLAALLLAAAGGLAYLWRRQRQARESSEAWWDDAERPVPSSMPQDAVPPTAATVVAAAAGMAAAPLAAEPEDAAPAASTAAAQTASDAMQLPTEIDLDDLLAVGAESSAATPDMAALAGVEDIPVVDFSPLAPTEQADTSPSESTPAFTAGAVAMPDFPAAGEVHIDVSHLSLSPVEPASPELAPSSSLLEFDLPDLDQAPGLQHTGREKDEPPAKA